MFHALIGRGPKIARRRRLRAQALRHPQAVRDARSRARGSTTTSSSTSAACRAGPWSTRGCSPPTSSAPTSPTTWATRALVSALCLFHSRFSTNTFPSWELAHPYRMISHNGEINTLARQHQLDARPRGPLRVRPVRAGRRREARCRSSAKGLSDTACLDNAVELLVKSGYSLPHAMMMLIPEAWENHETMSQVEEGLLRLPHLPDGGLGRPGVDRLHRRQDHRRRARPQRPAARAATSSPRTAWSSWPPRSARSTSRPRTSSSRAGSSRARCSWSTSRKAGSSTTRS